MSFDKTTAVIHLGPSALPQRYGPRRWLLWPLWGWKVAVPAVRHRGLNLFQHYTVALAARGVVRPEEVGKRLALGTELAAFITNQLKGMGHLKPDGTPSHRGVRYLEEYEDQEPEVIPGYVFQDGLTGQLWHRFVVGAPQYADLAADGYLGKLAPVELAAPGRKPRRQPCRVIWPDRRRRTPHAPSPNQVRRACRTWARHSQAWSRITGGSNEGWVGEDETLRHLGEGRITVLSRSPVPMFATCFLFLPEDIEEGSLWQVTDPFGLGSSTVLRARIEDMAEDGHILRGELDALSKNLGSVSGSEVAEARRALRAAAQTTVDAALDGLACPSGLRAILLEMESSRIALVPLSDPSGHAAYRQARRHHTSVVRRAWDAMEELFAELTATWANPDLAYQLGRKPEDNARILGQLASDLGFTDDEELDSFARFLLVTGGQARGVLEFENRSLPAMAACALLAARRPDHPFNDAPARFPDLFVFLDMLKRDRDPLAHYGSAAEPTLQSDVVVEAVFKACRALLEPAERGDHSAREPTADLSWIVAVAHRLQAQAAREVELKYGHGIRDNAALRHELIELIRMESELSAHPDDQPTGDLGKDLVLAGGAALEGALTLLLDSAPRPTWVSAHSTNELLQMAHALLGETGLNADSGLDGILHTKARNIERTAKTGRGTASGLALVSLLACRDRADHPLREIANRAPDFLEDIDRLIELRGHGNRGHDVETCRSFAFKTHAACHLILEHI